MSRPPLFKLVPGKTAFLVGNDTPCPVHEYNGRLYAHVGPWFRLLTPKQVGYKDSDHRAWIIKDSP